MMRTIEMAMKVVVTINTVDTAKPYAFVRPDEVPNPTVNPIVPRKMRMLTTGTKTWPLK